LGEILTMTPPGLVESEGAVDVHAQFLLGNRGGRLLYLGPFHHKVRQSLGLDHCLWDIGYFKTHELKSLLGNPSHSEAVSNNFFEPI
jgi:hypothetical protein